MNPNNLDDFVNIYNFNENSVIIILNMIIIP